MKKAWLCPSGGLAAIVTKARLRTDRNSEVKKVIKISGARV
jgi:hypothetical protein